MKILYTIFFACVMSSLAFGMGKIERKNPERGVISYKQRYDKGGGDIDEVWVSRAEQKEGKIHVHGFITALYLNEKRGIHEYGGTLDLPHCKATENIWDSLDKEYHLNKGSNTN